MKSSKGDALLFVGASARVAPLRKYTYFPSWYFLVVGSVHLHQPTRAARARKPANMVSANMASVALILGRRLGRGLRCGLLRLTLRHRRWRVRARRAVRAGRAERSEPRRVLVLSRNG